MQIYMQHKHVHTTNNKLFEVATPTATKAELHILSVPPTVHVNTVMQIFVQRRVYDVTYN